ncbi:MAG: DUF2339 domain-containing protein [Flavobacteriales bacterium]|nr:DUF2339 domain-containing protein [Flavobacteriales bacterium]
MSILNVGMLVLALLKRWNIVHLVALGSHCCSSVHGPSTLHPDLVPRPWKWGFLFATGFHLVFFAMAVGYNLRYNLKFRPLEFALLIGNTATYYAVGMRFLTDAPSYPMQKWTGLFTAALGLFHIVFAFVFYRRKQVPRNLVLLLIGLALTFCTLAVPVQLEGYTITIFWAAEAVLLLWFSQRAAQPMVARGSVLVAVLAVISLVMDLDAFYSILRPELRPIINPGWITGMVVVVCMVGLHLLFRREKDERDVLPAISIRSCANGALVLAVTLGYLVNLLELRNQSARFLSVDGVRMITMAFTLAYVLGLDLFTRRAGKQVRVVVFGLSILALIGYVTTFYEASGDSLKEMLTASARGFGIHYIGPRIGCRGGGACCTAGETCPATTFGFVERLPLVHVPFPGCDGQPGTRPRDVVGQLLRRRGTLSHTQQCTPCWLPDPLGHRLIPVHVVRYAHQAEDSARDRACALRHHAPEVVPRGSARHQRRRQGGGIHLLGHPAVGGQLHVQQAEGLVRGRGQEQ